MGEARRGRRRLQEQSPGRDWCSFQRRLSMNPPRGLNRPGWRRNIDTVRRTPRRASSSLSPGARNALRGLPFSPRPQGKTARSGASPAMSSACSEADSPQRWIAPFRLVRNLTARGHSSRLRRSSEPLRPRAGKRKGAQQEKRSVFLRVSSCGPSPFACLRRLPVRCTQTGGGQGLFGRPAFAHRFSFRTALHAHRCCKRFRITTVIQFPPE